MKLRLVATEKKNIIFKQAKEKEMMSLKYLYSILIALILISCSKMFYNSEGGVRPKKNNFLLSKDSFLLVSNDKIDTSVLYVRVLKNMALSSGKNGNRYQFYRFYENGRFQISETYENFEDHLKFQNINVGIIGYYKLENEILLCEFFAPTNGGEYVQIDGIAKDGIIIRTKMYPRHVGETIKLTDTLAKTSIKNITHGANW
jgi:hypothetical protein